MTVTVIYGLVDNSTMELRYVGKTTRSLAARWKAHLRPKKSNVHLNNWLHKADISAVVLERDPDDLDEAEIRWIRAMREQGARLLNIADGGMGEGPRSPETRQKISLSCIGRRVSEETRVKMSASHMGRAMSKETRTKMGAAKKGKQYALGHKHTPEARAKMSAAKIGHSVSEETRQKISDSHNKKNVALFS